MLKASLKLYGGTPKQTDQDSQSNGQQLSLNPQVAGGSNYIFLPMIFI